MSHHRQPDGRALEKLNRLPKVFLERIREIIPDDHWDEAVCNFTQPTPTTFRLNTLASDRADVLAELERAGLAVDPVSWYADAFTLSSGGLSDLQSTHAYSEGHIYVQSLSSMLPALVLDPQPDETVLDLTAAPGSKTTQMACLMRGSGTILANDNNRIRFYKLRANIERQKTPNVKLSKAYGQTFGKTHPDTFDRVLVDAPCSTEGRFYTAKPSSYQFWRPRKIHEMAKKQRALLSAGFRALKPGGRLVYSTCTFGPEENEAVVDQLLAVDESAEVESVSLPVKNTINGLCHWRGRDYNPDCERAVRVLPVRLMEGFFIAAIRKRA